LLPRLHRIGRERGEEMGLKGAWKKKKKRLLFREEETDAWENI
jgi:hypothetical protein